MFILNKVWEGVNWIRVALVNTVMKLRVPLKARNFLTR
jgi:hypothetical protein